MTLWDQARPVINTILISVALLLAAGFTILPPLYRFMPPLGAIIGGFVGLGILPIAAFGAHVIEWAHGEIRYRRELRRSTTAS